MKKILLATFILLAPAFASAHVLERDGTVGAVVHIDPNDRPVSGEPTTVYFDVKDTAEKFNFRQCTCVATVTRNGAEVGSASIPMDDGTAGSFAYTFPEAGAYTVRLMGVPSQPEAFQAFTLSYSVRAEAGDAKGARPVIWGVLSVVAVALIASLGVRRVRRRAILLANDQSRK